MESNHCSGISSQASWPGTPLFPAHKSFLLLHLPMTLRLSHQAPFLIFPKQTHSRPFPGSSGCLTVLTLHLEEPPHPSAWSPPDSLPFTDPFQTILHRTAFLTLCLAISLPSSNFPMDHIYPPVDETGSERASFDMPNGITGDFTKEEETFTAVCPFPWVVSAWVVVNFTVVVSNMYLGQTSTCSWLLILQKWSLYARCLVLQVQLISGVNHKFKLKLQSNLLSTCSLPVLLWYFAQISIVQTPHSISWHLVLQFMTFSYRLQSLLKSYK